LARKPFGVLASSPVRPGSEIERIAGEGIDTFITGEAPHWAAIAAAEMGLNLLLAGHYATETFGVKALAAHLAGNSSLIGNSSICQPVFKDYCTPARNLLFTTGSQPAINPRQCFPDYW
jgi:putative NIF3 family GTP cyclohydrolase 1 type 2